MTNKEFNKEQERLLHKMSIGTLEERMSAYNEYTHFMKTQSKNTHWNPKYNCICVGEKMTKLLKEKYNWH